MLNRHSDIKHRPHKSALPPLPKIDWQSIGQEAPTPVVIHYGGPEAALPSADIVIITWTSAEWSAFDHVFLNSDCSGGQSDRQLEKDWHFYSRGAPTNGKKDDSSLWGYYRMVRIKTAGGSEKDVLLFKSDTHLAYWPWIDGLVQLLGHIIDETKPDRLYSIGTAGGPTLQEKLGDTAITNAGHLRLKLKENKHVDYNHQTFACKTWFPALGLLPAVEKHLLFRLSDIVTEPELETLLRELHEKVSGSEKFGLKDLVNAPLDPSNLKEPKGLDKKDVPLLSTDYYFIAKGDDAAQFSVLEMDDAVIAHYAGERGVDYAFVRNISDPLVPDEAASGEAIPDEVRTEWSSLIYLTFGLYTSFNGALVAWSTIAGDDG